LRADIASTNFHRIHPLHHTKTSGTEAASPRFELVHWRLAAAEDEKCLPKADGHTEGEQVLSRYQLEQFEDLPTFQPRYSVHHDEDQETRVFSGQNVSKVSNRSSWYPSNRSSLMAQPAEMSPLH